MTCPVIICTTLYVGAEGTAPPGVSVITLGHSNYTSKWQFPNRNFLFKCPRWSEYQGFFCEIEPPTQLMWWIFPGAIGMDRIFSSLGQFEARRIFVYPIYGTNSFYGVVNRVEIMDTIYSFPTMGTGNAPLSDYSDKSCEIPL